VSYYVYVIGREQGPVKVGISADPATRLTNIQVGCPFQLKLLYVRKLRSRAHAKHHEKSFHEVWENDHIRGEWFKLDAEIAIEGVDCSIDTDEYFESIYGMRQ
jgi:predicted GIY-YIG superfamily endonuclease